MKTLRLHIGLMIAMTWLFSIDISPAAGVCRSFTDTRGRTVKGQLIGFDDVRQLVTIQRAGNHGAARASLADFSDSDQRYIHAWNFEQDFNEALDISFIRKTVRDSDARSGHAGMDCTVNAIGYEIKLLNRSDTCFESVEIEYCLFYRQGEHRQDGILYDDGVQYGRFIIESVMPGSRRSLTTEPVRILNETGVITSFGRIEGARGEVLGLWLRAHVASPSGIALTKENISPAGLGDFKDWTSRTIRAGLNK